MNAVIEYINRHKAENLTGWRKWVIGSLVAVLTILSVAVFAFRASMRGKELAKLQTERDKAKEAQVQAEVNIKLTTNAREALHHEMAADLAMERAQDLEEEIKLVEKQHAANESLIRSIRSWDDVDKVVK